MMNGFHNSPHPVRGATSVEKGFFGLFAPHRGAISVAVMLLLLFLSCHRNDDSLMGRWTVEKVNVAFDETRTTPEMVRQFGEMEKGNIIEITKDSVLTLITDGETLMGRCSLKGTRLTCEGKPFGVYEKRKIQTETQTPLGRIVVVYRKD